MRLERSATIDQPVDRIFDYVWTPENDPRWAPASLSHEMLSPAPMRVDSITEEDVGFLARPCATLGKSRSTSRRPSSPWKASPTRYALPSASCSSP